MRCVGSALVSRAALAVQPQIIADLTVQLGVVLCHKNLEHNPFPRYLMGSLDRVLCEVWIIERLRCNKGFCGGAGAAAISGLIDVTLNGGTVAASADGDASVALSAAHFLDFNGGQLSAVADGADAIGLRGLAINLGWTGAQDSVTASSYSGAVTVDDGQFFRGSGGLYSGRIEDNAALANERLAPANVIVSSGQNGSVAADRYFAAEGETVALTVSPDEGYELESLTIRQGETEVALDEDYCFAMPAGTVTVAATFAGKHYQIHAEEDARWEIQITDAAREGERVGFMAEISLDYWGAYELTDVTVTDANGDEVAVEEGEFIMPAGDVWVRPVFAPMLPIAFEIGEWIDVMMVQTDSHGWSPEDARALEGETVRFEPFICDDRFDRCAVTVTAEDGTPVACERYSEYYEEYDFTDTGWRFIMPGQPVTVRVALGFGDPDFTLPAHVDAIEDNAFEGDALMTVVDARNCKSVGAEAFKDCEALTQIRLSGECVIDQTAFDGCDTVFVFAPSGGAAEASCAENDHCVFVEETRN